MFSAGEAAPAAAGSQLTTVLEGGGVLIFVRGRATTRGARRCLFGADLLRSLGGVELPVVEAETRRLTGILVKNDLLLALLEGRGAEKRGTKPPWQT